MVTALLKDTALKELGFEADAVDVEELFPWLQEHFADEHNESDEYDTDLEDGK